LSAATERQDHVASLMDKAGLPFQFHFGADYRDRTTAGLAQEGVYSPEARARMGLPQLTPAEIGCAVSHRDVAKEAASTRGEKVLVLEDDVCVLPAGVTDLDRSIERMPARWSLAYFGYAPMNLRTPLDVRVKLWTYYPVRYALGSEKHNPRTVSRIYRRGWGRFWKKAGWFNNAHAYAIDSEAAQFIAETQAVISMEADVILNRLVRFSGLKAICLKSPLFEQCEDLPSFIGDRPSWD
jgi:GR25 family glycosyltransferase involved in LPS biosynthesis